MFDEQIRDLDAQTDTLLAEARGLTETGLAGDTLTRFEAIESEVSELRRRRDAIQRAETGLASDTLTREPGDTRPALGDGLQVLHRVDPWEPVGRYGDSPQAIRDRGLAANATVRGELITDEDRVRVDRVIRADTTPETAAYITAISRPAYASAFKKVFADERGFLRWTPEEVAAVDEVNATRTRQEMGAENRAALTTIAANGGYMSPFFLDPTILLSNSGTLSNMRQVARVETISSNVWHGVGSAGVTAEWTGESSEATDASPTFSQPTVTPIRGDAYIQASYEIVQDSNIAEQVGMLFADAKARMENTAFITGTGSTQPWGLVTRLSGITTSRVAVQTNGSFGAIDIFSMVNSLPARWQDRASWRAHWSIANIVRQMSPSGPGSNFWLDLNGPTPANLLGAPFWQDSSMFAAPLSSATASNDSILAIGDFSQFLVVDRIGAEIVFNNLVIGANKRPTGEVGWYLFFRTGSDVLTNDAFRLLTA